MSARWLAACCAVLPTPWPAWPSRRMNTGLPLLLERCSRAAALALCQMSTRGSFMPCTSITAGYAVPLRIWW